MSSRAGSSAGRAFSLKVTTTITIGRTQTCDGSFQAQRDREALPHVDDPVKEPESRVRVRHRAALGQVRLEEEVRLDVHLVDRLASLVGSVLVDKSGNFGDDVFVDGDSAARLTRRARERLVVDPLDQLSKPGSQKNRSRSEA